MKRLKFLSAGLLIAGFMMGCGDKAAVPSIAVSGQGRVEVAPDEAVTSFGITSEGKSLASAYQDNNTKMLGILKAVKESGIPEKDIQTSAFSVHPIYATDERGVQIPNQRAGYRVSQQAQVTVRDLSKVGGLIDRVMAEGTNEFNGIRFTSSRLEEIQKEAKALAAKDAAENARILTKSLGVGLGKLVRVSSEGENPYPMERSVMMMRTDASSAPEIHAGTLQVTASCSVEYAIAQ